MIAVSNYFGLLFGRVRWTVGKKGSAIGVEKLERDGAR